MILFCFVDGVFEKALSDTTLLPEAISIELSHQASVISIPKNTRVADPIRLLFLTKNPNIYRREHKVLMGENSAATIIEEFQADGLIHYTTEVMTELHMDHQAQLNYYKIQNESLMAEHEATLMISQKSASSITTYFADFGGLKTQETIETKLSEKNSQSKHYGLYVLKNQQQVQHQIQVEHAASFSTSLMLYKGILNNKAKVYFNGKALVHKKIAAINAHQANHNLLLSNESEARSKPELEIYSEDVKCTHGATIGQLNSDALFYLQARGIDKESALSMLTQAFVSDILDQIQNGYVRKYIQNQIEFINSQKILRDCHPERSEGSSKHIEVSKKDPSLCSG